MLQKDNSMSKNFNITGDELQNFIEEILRRLKSVEEKIDLMIDIK